MALDLVPVTMGSPRFVARELNGIAVRALWFPPTLHLVPHTHEEPVFGVMLHGSMRGHLGRRRYDCPVDTVFTEPAGEPHDNYFERQGGRVMALLPDTTRSDLFGPFSELLGRPSHFRNAQVVASARRMQQEMATPDALSVLAVETLAFEMLIAATRMQREPERPAAPAWLERLRDMLHDRALERLLLSDLARECDVHPRHLTRLFRQCYGTSIAAYVRTLRLHWAATQLRGGRASLSDIAFRAGFADQSHFTRVFRRHMGCTPGEMRRSSKG